MLGYASRATNSCLYMIDMHKKKVIAGDSIGLAIAGFSTDGLRKDGIAFYNKILLDSEKEWAQEVYTELLERIFPKYEDLEERMSLVFSYDLLAKNPNGREVTLYHRLVPYQLDKIGSLRLALCSVSASSFTYKATKACADFAITGKRYDYVDGKFVLSQHKYLTQEEIAILGYLAEGMAIKRISGILGMCLRTIERKKKKALDKLKAQTQAAAVYRAKSMGLI